MTEYLTKEQRAELERQLAADENRTETRLKVSGKDLTGLLNYHVDAIGITIEADCTEIDGDEVEELMAEIREVVRIHRELKGGG